jgi:Holliday junction resolvase RusA-like endonuclease
MRFTIIFPPTHKARARHRTISTKDGRTFSHTYPDPKTKVDTETLGFLLLEHRPPEPLTTYIAMKVDAYLPIPKSMSKKRRQMALDGILRPDKKPDIDNLEKQLLDQMRKKFFIDDCQIVDLHTRKLYGEPARWEIEVESLPGPE